MYTEVSDVKREEGSMRCDANISAPTFMGKKLSGLRPSLRTLNLQLLVKKGLVKRSARPKCS